MSIAAHAQQTANCPIAETEYGTDVERTFTDRTGRSTKIFFHLPPGHDPAKPTGILMYFHGNDDDPQDSYVAPLYLLQGRAAAHGLVAAGLKSIGTRVNEDGSRSREWVNADSNLFNDLLLSDFGGCFKLDRTRVYLEGASQGTCFLQAALTLDLWRDFQGGVLGLCGCWGYGEYDYPVNVPFLRGRFKVLVENTTEDFLYDQGVLGFDTYKYNFGVDVRADLDRPGGHCEASRVNTDAALEWMVDKTSYPDPDAGQAHWQVVDMQHNGLEDIAYDPAGRRFVFAVQRAEVSAELLAEIERERRTTFVEDPAGFLDWRLENYPEYDVPPVLIYSSSDFGASFERLGRRESTGNENLRDMAVAPDGSILVVAGLGVRKVNETTGMFDDFAFPQMLVYGLDRDDDGNLFAHGAVIGLQRSADSGVTWSELTVPAANQYQQWTVQHRGGYLTVIGSDNQIHYSQDGGETFEAAALPAGMLVDFANYGSTFYALLDDGTLQVSADAGASWGIVAVPGDFARNVEVLANGDAVISTAAVAYDVGLAYRSTDKGGSWQRERGAHNDARVEFVQGEGEQAMMVTTRGIFRYSTGDQLDLGEPPPPLTAPNGGAANGGGAGLSGQAGSTGGSGGTAGASGSSASSTGGATATGGGGSGNATSGNGGASQAGTATSTDGDDRDRADSEGGCGCRTAPHRSSPLAAALAALGMALAARRRRARSARAST